MAPYVDPDDAARRARERGVTDVHLNPVHVRRDPGVVARLHRLGLLVAVGVLDDPLEAGLMARLGVDMLCTDDPARLARAQTFWKSSPQRLGRSPVAAPVTTS